MAGHGQKYVDAEYPTHGSPAWLPLLLTARPWPAGLWTSGLYANGDRLQIPRLGGSAQLDFCCLKLCKQLLVAC